jgi:class I fructose-bisphosphate aldolase
MHVFMSGGPKAPTDDAFLEQVKGVIDAGGTGVAVGRNVWQNSDPFRMAERLTQTIFQQRSKKDEWST